MEKIFAAIIFLSLMSCSITKPEKFETRLPKDTVPDISQEISSQEMSLTIEIKSDGKIILDEKEIGTTDDLSGLAKELPAAINRRKSDAVKDATAVIIKVSKNMKYGEAVKITDLAKSLGASPVGLQIDYSIP